MEVLFCLCKSSLGTFGVYRIMALEKAREKYPFTIKDILAHKLRNLLILTY